MIESKSTLGEHWTHVAVTLDESTIKLYLNGELEAVQEIDGIPTLNSYGFLEPSPVDIISTDTKVIIGAQEFEKKNTIKYKNYFSGDIDEIIIQDKMLDDYEIVDLCQSSIYFSA